jgi:hypothetical protein
VALPDIELLTSALNLLDYGELPYVKVPLMWFNNLMDSMGIDAHQFHDHFKPVDVETPYPIVHGGEEELRMKMLVRPNAYAYPKTNRAGSIFRSYSGRVLVPDRIRWDTAHVIALYSREPLLSNIFYAIKLKIAENTREHTEKALVLWLNTIWGLLTVLISRQETESMGSIENGSMEIAAGAGCNVPERR